MKVGFVGREPLLEGLVALVVANGHTAESWTPDGRPVDGASPAADPAHLGAFSDLLVVGVPAAELRATVRRCAPDAGTRLLVVSHGLDPGSGRPLSELVELESACLRVGVLAGPLFASEVRRGSPGAAVVASRFDEVGRRVSAALHSRLCRVYPSPDLAGVELSVALVDVLGCALGAARGLGMGVGLQAMVVTRGLAEGARLLQRAGADPRTFAGLAGAGKLVAAAALPDDEDLQRGLALARGEPDAAMTARCDALLGIEKDLPITAAVRAVAGGQANAKAALGGLLERVQRGELGR